MTLNELIGTLAGKQFKADTAKGMVEAGDNEVWIETSDGGGVGILSIETLDEGIFIRSRVPLDAMEKD